MLAIIPKKIIAVEHNWQKELAMAFSDPVELLNYLQLPLAEFDEDIKARALFPLRIPRPFAARMAKNDRHDPLFKQVFTSQLEFNNNDNYSTDPLGEHQNSQPGILHKYQSRLLMLIRGGCAVNCRYCFRRHFPYADNHLNRAEWVTALDYIRADTQLNEVIYSGGDPLMAKDDFLAWLTQEIATIPHITRLRIHTRLPVVIPSRITNELISWLTNTRLKPVMVLHINHANEIDESVKRAMAKLKQAGVTLLNQTVLLKGINDEVEQQVALSEALFEGGILPYYLHLLDKVQGASHFDTDEQEARLLMAGLIKRLPGYLVPKLVREIAGQPGKTPLDLLLQP
ncbi:EF-P beta-lysylation protein EpmB [Paraglaciecola hydrolytica]|uniref:L-lysine 2,3-aminomutase n=1 Tax=Paraglaciecola hydrolytica TaxID=1799789 RepID=A0A136A4U3_9ALTE|nr:EF-P beta-lysylation protein EpmB [Paraglaciecola hydrolytica]KXI30268.1 EF-P beta-lysylation protein EpmB [Paraglaciecola hydrolytica]